MKLKIAAIFVVAFLAGQGVRAADDFKSFKGASAELEQLGIVPASKTKAPAPAVAAPTYVPTPMTSVPAAVASAVAAPVVLQNVPVNPPTLEEARLTMGKWIETQQIISKERKDWQQGKEILSSRLELVKKEIAVLEEKIAQNKTGVMESENKRAELEAENESLKKAAEQLTASVLAMEKEIRRLFSYLPQPLQERLKPLYDRIPENPAKTNVSVAERFQNALGILNELNKANNEITVNYEVHTLSNGKPSEVKAIYVGLAQAYYVSMKGEGGIGRPGSEGWKWEPSKKVAPQVNMALEIIEGKHSPVFVPMPVSVE